ncbi:integrase core domain-containing protein [Demequina zhanjiangensis]|uniref:integrase core domain-containing protein n=1 Tax=Demequina zhanjiangensis TaxID=3051659 RepID=UPI003F559207
MTEARVLIGQWIEHYNTERPHSGLKMKTSQAFARYCAQQAATTSVSQAPA